MSVAEPVVAQQAATTVPAEFHRRGRFPLVPVALAICAGIAADRAVRPELFLTVLAASMTFVVCLVSRRSQQLRVVGVLSLCLCLGAIRHHLVWWTSPQNDIGHLLEARPKLIKVEGVVLSRPIRRRPPAEALRSAIPQTVRTQFTLATRLIKTPSQLRPVSGRLQVTVSGDLAGIPRGSSVRLLGDASGLPVARNPGEIQFADSLRQQSIRGTLRVNNPNLVEVLERGRNPYTLLTGWIRDRCEKTLLGSLGDRSLPIASALLLGDRSMISRSVRASFVESGTMHLLAISGLHVGILAGFMFTCCRFVGLGARRSVLAVLFLIMVYLGVADLRPPVVRAATLIGVWGIGKLTRRMSFSANSLAAAAIVVLTLNPADLFDVGAQLSFVAVAAIVWLLAIPRMIPDADDNSGSPATVLLPRWKQLLIPLKDWVWTAYKTSGLIWLLTAPLVASAFNVISVVGIVINVLLIPFVGATLCLGFVCLIAGGLHPALGAPFAEILDWMLQLLLDIVEPASRFPFGHFYVPAPSKIWLIGAYSLFAMAMLRRLWDRRSQWLWVSGTLWALFGISVAMRPSESRELRCTFLSVGHGLSVLIETPNGNTMLYDVGSLANGEVAARAVEHALWHQGHRDLDVLVVSHADIDHYNGAVSLFDTVPVRQLIFSRHFLDRTQAGTLEVKDAAIELGTALKQVQTGDQIEIDQDLTIRVLHPKHREDYSSDNEASIVLEITYAGRRILLTGDLERKGLWDLMAEDRGRFDILLAPHHGSLAANPASLARWCKPSWIVASSGRRFPGNRLREQYDEYGSRVLSTFEEGAVQFTISSGGKITRKSWRDLTTTSTEPP